MFKSYTGGCIRQVLYSVSNYECSHASLSHSFYTLSKVQLIPLATPLRNLYLNIALASLIMRNIYLPLELNLELPNDLRDHLDKCPLATMRMEGLIGCAIDRIKLEKIRSSEESILSIRGWHGQRILPLLPELDRLSHLPKGDMNALEVLRNLAVMTSDDIMNSKFTIDYAQRSELWTKLDKSMHEALGSTTEEDWRTTKFVVTVLEFVQVGEKVWKGAKRNSQSSGVKVDTETDLNANPIFSLTRDFVRERTKQDGRNFGGMI